MTNQMTPIILQKKREVAALHALIQQQPKHPIAKILSGEMKSPVKKSFKAALKASSLAIIAEIKRKSPSKGSLAAIDDPISLARDYIQGGASALSILTDETFFGGTLEDLSQVAVAICDKPNPILRKDFIIHEIQIAEAILAGADAILCIVAVLGEKTKTMLDFAKSFGIEAIVEVHNQTELAIALESGADMIGINNRNLKTFAIDTQNAFHLLENIPQNIIKVAESGIVAPTLAQEYHRAGFDAVLIGEALVTSASPSDFMRACRHA